MQLLNRSLCLPTKPKNNHNVSPINTLDVVQLFVSFFFITIFFQFVVMFIIYSPFYQIYLYYVSQKIYIDNFRSLILYSPLFLIWFEPYLQVFLVKSADTPEIFLFVYRTYHVANTLQYYRNRLVKSSEIRSTLNPKQSAVVVQITELGFSPQKQQY